MQRIEITNFGPITGYSQEIKDFTLLIGPQASGKSTIAKTIYFFKSLNDDLKKYFLTAIEKKDFSKPIGTYAKSLRQKFLDYFGSSIHLNGLNLKYYYTENLWIGIVIEPSQKYVNPIFSTEFEDSFKSLAKEVSEFFIKHEQYNPSLLTSKDLLKKESEKRKFIAHIEEKCNNIFHEDRELIFIPAGRSLMATLSDQLQYINPRKLDFLTRSFLEKINLIRPVFTKSLTDIIKDRILLTQFDIDYNKTKLAEEIISKILKGKYQNDVDGEKIFFADNKYVKLNFSSSGQQESLWILLLLFIIILEKQNVFIVIEEPEAHLFPEAQREISKLIALMSNIEKSQVVITTHSPYILASINNLILAHKAGISHNKKVTERINKNLWLDNNKVFAALVSGGKAIEIIDDELNIIQNEKIDSVSNLINEEFDFLYQYEPI